jgi:hypothetical protein
MKKNIYIILAILALLFGFALPAQARGHFVGGIWLGPVWGPFYPYPYSYYSPPVVIREEPQVIMEPQPEEQYWYYCTNPKGYYPYVKQCPAGWTKVVPRPPQE